MRTPHFLSLSLSLSQPFGPIGTMAHSVRVAKFMQGVLSNFKQAATEVKTIDCSQRKLSRKEVRRTPPAVFLVNLKQSFA